MNNIYLPVQFPPVVQWWGHLHDSSDCSNQSLVSEIWPPRPVIGCSSHMYDVCNLICPGAAGYMGNVFGFFL